MRKRYLIAGAVLLLLITLPYLIAQALAGPTTVFGGFLFNPMDGNTYLAKMRQGWAGNWTFELPYSAEPNPGAYLFLFYLFLGHVSRVLGLSTVVVFHLARVLAAVCLLFALQAFFSTVFVDRPRVTFWAFLFSVFGSGLGWLAALFGGFTSDFWVAEAYPFLSMYSNPHFSLGMAILLWFLTQYFKPFHPRNIPLLALAGLLLGIVFPFGVVVAAVVIAGALGYDWLTKKSLPWQTAVVFLLAGGVTVLYQFVVIRTDPILAAWDRQNQTPSPAGWDFLVSFLPLLALAAWGAFQAVRSHDRRPALLVGWLALGALLIYFPFNLQRRFIFAYLTPIAGLAAYGVAGLKVKRRTFLQAGALAIALPTLAIILAGGIASARNQDPALMIDRSEMDAFTYLSQHGRPGDLVLATPESGLLVPAYTGLRVLYGHPFETINAPAEKQAVEKFFSQPVGAESIAWARARGVRWILWGTQGSAPGDISQFPTPELKLAFERDGVKLFELQGQP